MTQHKLVPMAWWMGMPPTRVRTGVMIRPPPIPVRAPIAPANTPRRRNSASRRAVGSIRHRIALGSPLATRHSPLAFLHSGATLAGGRRVRAGLPSLVGDLVQFTADNVCLRERRGGYGCSGARQVRSG